MTEWLGRIGGLLSEMWRNPIVVKEIRGRMRGWRAPVVLIIHVGMLSCFASFIYLTVAESTRASGGGAAGQVVGRTLFHSTYMLLLAMVVFLSPAFTAGAISGERERKTLDLLITTLLPTHSLVLGKLASALAYIVLLILAALPIQSLALLFGGIVLPEVLIGTLILLATALIAGSVGIAVSSVMRSSIASTVLTYATILLTTLGLPIVAAIAILFLGSLLDPVLRSMSWLLQAMLIYGGGLLICTNPFATAVATKIVEEEERSLLFFTIQLTDATGGSHALPLISPWIVYVAICIATSALLVLFSILFVRWKRG